MHCSWTNPRRFPALTVAVLVIADQLSKYAILTNPHLRGGHKIVVIPDFFAIVYVHNPGAAWGILADNTLLLTIISGTVLVGMTLFFRHLTDGFLERCVAISLLLGGIAGNFIDRVFRNGVVDFLSFTYRSFEWPAFNVADSAICTGVALYLMSSFLRPDPDSVPSAAVEKSASQAPAAGGLPGSPPVE